MNPQRKMVYMQKLFNPSQHRSSPNCLTTLTQENFNAVMIESINKAISPKEGPVKTKHLRLLLIGSHQISSGSFFWQNVPIIRLKEDQIVCWKFCHVVHKMIRDGHRDVLMCSDKRRGILLDCGNMWRHVQDGYGQLIYRYCALLFNRIIFLMRNPGFPSDLKVTDAQLDEIGDNDPNVFFDLSCEIFDALDDILRLQELVMVRMHAKRLNSISTVGQCHLAPLVTCIQDSSLFYDYSVKILFKLHGSLPSSTLEGHRSRFLLQHNQLKRFYTNTNNQYFRSLIQVPQLPDKPPNFLIASELQHHVAPQVVMIASQEHESPDQILIDLGDEDNDDEVDDNQSSSFDTRDHHSQVSEQQLFEPSSSMQGSSAFQQVSKQSSPELAEPPPPDYGAVADSTTRARAASRERDGERIQELELMVEQLRSELDMERESHSATKRVLQGLIGEAHDELKRVQSELGNLKLHVISSKKAFDALDEECKRAKHDSEISQVAMRKMVKEMTELRGKQRSEQSLAALAQREADTREEDLLVAEMNETDKIIKEATRKIESLGERSRKVETGIKLEVNEKILDVCTNLMKAVRNLIAQSRLLQREIVNSEEGQMNKEEFYRRNSDWTEGLISAANVVAMATRSLVDAADRSISSQPKTFCELAAAAHSITAAISQLVIASKVKANKDSEKLKLLMSAAKQVNQCTSNVVEASRVCAELIDQQEVDKIDIGSLSLHQTKRLEMETQVRLIELEDELSKQRSRLGLLRRKHYEEEEKEQERGEVRVPQANESQA